MFTREEQDRSRRRDRNLPEHLALSLEPAGEPDTRAGRRFARGVARRPLCAPDGPGVLPARGRAAPYTMSGSGDRRSRGRGVGGRHKHRAHPTALARDARVIVEVRDQHHLVPGTRTRGFGNSRVQQESPITTASREGQVRTTTHAGNTAGGASGHGHHHRRRRGTRSPVVRRREHQVIRAGRHVGERGARTRQRHGDQRGRVRTDARRQRISRG